MSAFGSMPPDFIFVVELAALFYFGCFTVLSCILTVDRL